LFATIAGGDVFRQLDTSVGVSGPHGFAVRKISAFVNAPLASTASRSTSVTIAKRPSSGTGCADIADDLCSKSTATHWHDEAGQELGILGS
jgi:hypothetical protein